MKWIALSIAMSAVACSADNGVRQRERAEEIASAYLASKSMFDARLRATVDDAGETWLVTYHIPDGAIGGNQEVWVDKRTMKVVDAVSSQ